jgi:hypothetical protein
MSRAATLARSILARSPLVLAVALIVAWAWVFAFRIARTPPQLSNEAEIMYEASRIARGLALYTDPLQGARDDGPLPIRHYVLYGPLAPWLLSMIREPARLVFARWVSAVCWFLGLPLIARVACPEKGDHRRAAIVVALSYAGLF